MHKTSPLRHLDLSDAVRAADLVAEKGRELAGAYDLIESQRDAIKGLLAVIHAIENNHHGVSEAVRESLKNDTRVIDAVEILR
jgi:hypothetical protein